MTNETRKLIKSQLDSLKADFGVKEVYYKEANDKKLFPHVVFYFDGVNSYSEDNNRLDYRLIVDVWDKGPSSILAENITDAVIKLFKKANLPQEEILPTMYLESSRSVLDEDKDLKHNQIRFTIQNYER